MSEIGHNSGCIAPEDAAERMRLALAPWEPRAAEFEAKADKVTVKDNDTAQLAVDFVRMVKALREKAAEIAGEQVQPFNDAARAVVGVRAQFVDRLEAVERAVRDRLTAYNRERQERADAAAKEQREAEAKLAAAAAERDGAPAPAAATPAAPARRSRIRTDLGGVMTEQARWKAEVEDVSLVPLSVLQSTRVKEAIRLVATDLLKNGIEVPGVKKVEFTSTTIS